MVTLLSCMILDKWQQALRNPPPPHKCKCKIIRTHGSAINTGIENEDYSAGYTTYKPILDAYHYLPGGFSGDDDDVILYYGKMGAAKSELLNVHGDGPNAYSFNTIQNVSSGFSMVSMRNVCVDPSTLYVNTSECPGCQKRIELIYGYDTYGDIEVNDRLNLLFGTRIFITTEEFASLAVAINGDAAIVDTTGFKLVAECDKDDDWNLDSLLISAKNVYDAVSAITDIASIFNAATVVAEVLSKIIKPRCHEFKSVKKKMTGTKIYTLEPGQRFTAVIVSLSKYRVITNSSCHGYSRVKSDVYLSALLESLPDENGEVPEYCTCDALASYVWGSMRGFTPDPRRPREKSDDSKKRWPDIAGMNNNTPMSPTDIKAIIGSFIGESGINWQGKFDYVPGNCCRVIIPCHADCVYVSEGLACTTIGSNNMQLHTFDNEIDHYFEVIEVPENSEMAAAVVLNEMSFRDNIDFNMKNYGSLNVYPNPAWNQITVESSMESSIVSIVIFDQSGRNVKSELNLDCTNNCHINIDIAELSNGLYFLQTNFSDGNFTLTKIVKSGN
jgi:hypothetical protein